MTLTKNSKEVKDFAALISLPPGWCWIPFEEITINYDGKRVPITSSARKSGVFPYYGASGIIDYVDDYLFDGDYLLIAEDGANLLSRSTPIAFEANGKFWVNNHAHIVQVPGNIIPLSYLREYFNSTDIRFYISGSAQPKLNQKNLNRIEIPLAPLNEQCRIVAKIEALKARSQRVKEELEAIPALLDQFRQSVLAAAFRGDLTADWREKNPDVEPTSVLLERIRAERRRRWEEAELEKMKAQGKTPKDDKWKEKYKEPEFVDTSGLSTIPETWTWTILDNICQKITDGEHLTPPITGSGVYLLSAKDVRDGYLDFSDTKFVSEEFAQKSRERCNPEKDDILVVSRGATVGRTCRVKTDNIFCLMGSVLLFKLYQNCIKPSIVEFAFKSPYGIKKLSSISGASAQQAIYIRDMRNFAISVPPLLEQQEIISCIQTLLRVADQVEQQYQEAKAYLEQLDQSILAKAFRGELVPQDPNDEPASVLLERIRAEREKLDTKKKAKGKTEKKSRKAKPEPPEPEQLSLPGFE